MKKIIIGLSLLVSTTLVMANKPCHSVMNAVGGYQSLKTALLAAVQPAGGPSNGGFDLNMWATVVANDGTVCAVTKTGNELNAQWLGSRVISAQKANTANAFSITSGLALSTANLWSASQPGGSLFGLQLSNPVNPDVAYKGQSRRFGTSRDPMVNKRIGGINVFGGGLALYNASGELLGAVGVSGDSSCADHNVAWRVRDALRLDYVPAGLTTGDNIIFDIDPSTGLSDSGFGHPVCTGVQNVAVNEQLLIDHPLSQ